MKVSEMSFVPAWNVKRYSARSPIFGAVINGGSLWGRIKAVAKKIFNSPSVRNIASGVASKLYAAAPGLVDKALEAVDKKVGHKLPAFLAGHRNTIRDKIREAANTGLTKGHDKLQDVFHGRKAEPSAPIPELAVSEGSGVKVARAPKKYSARKKTLFDNLMKNMKSM